jgi:GMP synthase-like glutamine amidotransferase
MKLGILETGAPPPGLDAAFGDYPAMFRALLGADAHDYRTYDVAAGDLPQSPDACEAYIVTGSSAGVYETLPWIEPLMGFLRAAKGRTPLVGICFGHQAMAQAFGGKVIQSPKGWGVGLHRYEVARCDPWMDGAQTIAVAASHQDQVVQAPPGSTVLAASEFTPFGMLDHGERAVSLQLHPEFDPAYAQALIEARRGTRFSEDQADAAIASLAEPNDRVRVGGWIARFLDEATVRGR